MRAGLLQDVAAVHEEDAIRHRPGERQLVGDDEQGHAAAGEIADHLQHLLHHLGIQRSGHLVKQHHLGVHAQGSHDSDALLLAAGELARIVVTPLPEANPGQQLLRLQQRL
ncbi:hypothetical protein D3C77_590080 [compost metagenome]